MNTIPKEMIVNSVEHRYAGNSWAVVATLENGWAAITGTIKLNMNSQIFKVWDKLLSLEKKIINEGTPEKPKWVKSGENVPLHPDSLVVINKMRSAIESGSHFLKNTRLVKV